MAEVTAKRRGEMVRGAFQVLMNHPEGLPPQDVIAKTLEIVPPSEWELTEYAAHPGVVRYYRLLRFHTIRPSKAGWLRKTGKVWILTDAGRQAWSRFQDPAEFDHEANRLYQQWKETRTVIGGRAWLVRGSNVSGVDLVQHLWLPVGIVSLQAARLRKDANLATNKDELRAFVEDDYESTATYNQKQELVEEFHSFLFRMRPGDTLATISGGQLYLGEITGEAEQSASEDGRSNLRRHAQWQDDSFAYDELPAELQQKLSVQHDVVELTTVVDLLRTLGLSDEDLAEEEPDDPTVETPVPPRREVELPNPDQALADELLVERSWLQEIRDLLADDKQLVFYGPPGTGKTFLAQAIAEHLGGAPEQVKLVQFHPSYSYEDFFEGFRPREHPKTGEVAFRLTAGPLRELADRASREGNRPVPHFLIIDELNRANLAKVFGELYFLLEYRNRSVRLTYSAEDFALPPNVFIIGTMNTADRSIALVDAAMRRRFAFVELSPNTEPTRGLLWRWLKREKKDPEPALLLDALNSRITDADFKIGPSYFMKKSVYRDGGLERTWRTKILPLLEEHHYGEDLDVGRTYGLAALRKAIQSDRQTSRFVMQPGDIVWEEEETATPDPGPAVDTESDQ